MPAIDCPWSHHLVAPDDAQPFRPARAPIDRDHPEMDHSDEQIGGRIAADAYDLAPVSRR